MNIELTPDQLVVVQTAVDLEISLRISEWRLAPDEVNENLLREMLEVGVVLAEQAKDGFSDMVAERYKEALKEISN